MGYLRAQKECFLYKHFQIQNEALLVVMLCSLVDGQQCFRGICCLHFQGLLKIFIVMKSSNLKYVELSA
jgi:hypothetical protein